MHILPLTNAELKFLAHFTIDLMHVLADRIKLPLSFDADRMLEEINRRKLKGFIYYDVLPLTTPKRKPDLPAIIDYADGTWADWHDTKELTDSPYLMEIVEYFRKHCDVTLVRLLRLEAGAVVKEHTDPTLGLHIERSVIRLTIPILVAKGVTFFLNNSPVPMLPGECWYLNLTDPHRIENGSDRERINMSIDMRPNDWIKSLISSSAQEID